MKTINRKGCKSASNTDELTNEFAHNCGYRAHSLTGSPAIIRTAPGYAGVVLQACSVYRWAHFFLYHFVILNINLVEP
jgi:hypothetical protein